MRYCIRCRKCMCVFYTLFSFEAVFLWNKKDSGFSFYFKNIFCLFLPFLLFSIFSFLSCCCKDIVCVRCACVYFTLNRGTIEIERKKKQNVISTLSVNENSVVIPLSVRTVRFLLFHFNFSFG